MNKALFVANSSSGLYGFRNELMRAVGKTHRVIACTPDDGWMDRLRTVAAVDVVDIDRRGVNPLKDMRLLAHFFRLIRRERPQIVVTYTIKPNIYAGLASRALKVPYAANITGLGTTFEQKGLLRAVVCLLYKAALKKARVVFFENTADLRTVLDLGLIRVEQAQALSGAGVNLTHYAASAYPPADGVTRFLFIGRIMKEKGVEELFAAVDRLHTQGERVFLDIVGPYEEDYSAAIERLEKKGIAAYHGETEDVRPYIAGAHCFVLPSYHEGMANTLLECASMARPLITSRIPGCQEAVEEGLSGFLAAPHDTDSLAEAMGRFIRLPHEARARMGLRGRAHMEKVFDKAKVVQRTLDGLKLV